MGEPTAYRSGVAFGAVAYVWWGLVPLYFAALHKYEVHADEILAHRIAWSLPLMLALVAVVGSWRELYRVLRSRKLVLTLLLSSALLAGNWLLYIHAVVTGQVTEASLGYYMMPIVNAFLATLVLGEKLRPLHYPALALVAVGVAVPFVAAGHLAWVAVVLPVTFGFYGLVRKQIPVDSTTGLTVETLLMIGPSVGYVVWLMATRQGKFGPDWGLNGLLAFGGVVTVVPLLTYTLSLRRLPLLANSFMQFLSPTMQFLVAVYWLGEPMAPERWAAIGCVWAAVALFVADAVAQVRARRRAPEPEPELAEVR